MQALRASVIFRVKMEISIGVLLELMSSQLIERLSSAMLDADDVPSTAQHPKSPC